ncbi:valine--tRNA ligase [Candidatus Woesearchaeota archaeon]|nr:valine--tRNA ligase [Candidatus Woesearchaeota archaeon]
MAEPKIQGKRWNKALEEPIVKEWREKELYKFEKDSDKPIYSIDTPPPYVNTPIHMGHASTYSIMDMIARFRRMLGYRVLFPLGLDRNGLPIEMQAEKKFKVNANEIPREEFLKMCLKVLEESSAESVDSFMKLGIGFNRWKTGKEIGDIYETDSDDYRALTQDTFIDLYKKGLIYEDERVNNYCPGCQTTIADSEIDYKDLPSKFIDVKWKIKETGDEVIIATTRPEFLASCAMVCFHPDDDRYKYLEGKTAIVPLYDFEVPIKSHTVADPEKGTGLMMICSFGDYSDVRFFRDENLEPKILINIDGTMNEKSGFLKGLKVKDARKKIAEMLREKNLILNETNVLHRTPVCERSKDPIEFIGMSELYLKQVDFKDKMRELADQINFYEPKSKQILLNWIDTVSIDWPISRRRVYATEVPLWYCDKCGEVIVPPKGSYYKPWKEKCPIAKCPKCGNQDLRGDERVFDTWFDSSITPLYVLKWSRDNGFFAKAKPCTLRPQGKEIVRTWLYYTVLKDYLLTDEVIFKDVWIHQHITDEKGYKMSKSAGNIIDPQVLLEKFGAEPIRLWCAVEGNLTKTDFKCSNERIEGASKTLTKLWNVCRFISMFPKPETEPEELLELDKWIITELNQLIELCNENFMFYDFHNPVIKIKHFLWETFASHYLELVKKRVYNNDNQFTEHEQQSGLYTLYYVMEDMLKLLAPIIPIITYKLYYDLNEKDIHFEKYPEVKHDIKTDFTTEDLTTLNSLIWKTKKDAGKSLKDEITSVTAKESFKAIEKDLIATHNIKNISYDKELKVEL